MEKEIISGKQGVTLITMFLIGSSLIITPGIRAGRDVWIAIITAMVLVLPMLYVYSRLVTIYPGMDLYDLLQYLFGKTIGTIISLLFILYSLHLGAMILRNFSEFIQAVSFPETPQYVTLILLGTLCIMGTRLGIEVLARWSAFVFPVIFATVSFLVLLSLPYSEIVNIKPILYDGFTPVLKNSLTVFAYPFAEVAIFTMVFNSLKNKKSTFRIYLTGTIIGGFILTAVAVRNIAVLGAESIASYYFPAYNAVSVISIGKFFDRFEIIVAIMFVMSGFLKAAVCLYAAGKGLTKVFGFKQYSYLSAPLGIIMFTTASFVYENIMEMFKWVENVYKYYSFLYLVLLPLITLVFAEIKFSREKQGDKGRIVKE